MNDRNFVRRLLLCGYPRRARRSRPTLRPFLSIYDVKRAFLDVERGFSDGFAQRGMRMTGTTDIFGAAAEFDHRNRFGDQFRSGMMENVSAKNAIGFCVDDELDHSFHIITAKGAAVSAEWKFTDAHIDPLLLRLVFSQTNASQLGICVDDARNGLIVHVAGLACDDFHACYPFVFGLVR